MKRTRNRAFAHLIPRIVRQGIIVLCSWLAVSVVQANEPVQAIFPKEEGREQASSYVYQLLDLALTHSQRPYELKLTQSHMPEARARALIEKNSALVTVVFSGTSRQFEETLKPVRIPLYGGLLGHRLFLINRQRQSEFNAIKTLEALKPLTSGQGSNWSDVEILSAAGLNVHTTKYHLLFGLLEKQRIDYFPRGVTEIFEEHQRYHPQFPNLAIESKLVLVYPFASFFFVSQQNTALHDAIYEGLVRAHQNGAFHTFFRSHPSTYEALKQANLKDRVRIDIPNPLMTEETLAIEPQYWFNPTWEVND